MLKNDITWEAPRYPSEPPWRWKELCVDILLSKEGNKKQNPEIIAAVAKEKIDRSRNNLDLHIYTDASKTPDGRMSAAFCIPEFDFKCGVRLTDTYNNFYWCVCARRMSHAVLTVIIFVFFWIFLVQLSLKFLSPFILIVSKLLTTTAFRCAFRSSTVIWLDSVAFQVGGVGLWTRMLTYTTREIFCVMTSRRLGPWERLFLDYGSGGHSDSELERHVTEFRRHVMDFSTLCRSEATRLVS